MLKNIEIIGLMSGTSLDGLDIAHVAFDFSAKRFQHLNYCIQKLFHILMKFLQN